MANYEHPDSIALKWAEMSIDRRNKEITFRRKLLSTQIQEGKYDILLDSAMMINSQHISIDIQSFADMLAIIKEKGPKW